MVDEKNQHMERVKYDRKGRAKLHIHIQVLAIRKEFSSQHGRRVTNL